ncbi:MAG: hypothetical protein QF733_09060 [Phycisphaerales bacterium]|nr:hypothetical protein [Phycisphaerales bacterium]
MIRPVAMAVVLVLGACGAEVDREHERQEIRRTVRNCGMRLITEGRKWYDGLQPDLAPERFAAEVEVMVATGGWIRTYEVVMDTYGVPVDVTWDQAYWDAASLVLTKEELVTLKNWSVGILKAVRTATGVHAPPSWRSPQALPTASAIARESGVPLEAAIASLEQFIPVSSEGAVTQRLRSVMSKFPGRSLFPAFPEAGQGSDVEVPHL